MSGAGYLGGACGGGRECASGGTIKCAKHAALYGAKVMEERGWVLLEEYGDNGRELDAHFLDMIKAVHAAGVEMERWYAGWDAVKNVPRYGIWAPRIASAVLGLLSKRVNADDLTRALRAAKADPEFAAAVDAAWRMGGKNAADELIKERLPNLRVGDDYAKRFRR